MATVAFCNEMIAIYQTRLRRHAGTTQLQNDGSMVTLANLEKKLEHWEDKKRAAVRAETSGITERPAVAEIDLR